MRFQNNDLFHVCSPSVNDVHTAWLVDWDQAVEVVHRLPDFEKGHIIGWKATSLFRRRLEIDTVSS